MKFILITLLMATQAFAHPTDEMPMTKIPKGTKLVTIVEINIPPMTEVVSFQEGKFLYTPMMIDIDKPVCALGTSASANDRVLKAGREIIISEVTVSGKSQVMAKSEVIDPKDFGIIGCAATTQRLSERNFYSNSSRVITIGEFKAALAGYFELVLPAPEEI